MPSAAATASATPALSLVPQGLEDPSLYINRELSWLEFNRRVLEEALDPTVPFLERMKFLAIFSANLDEFFMVRVGGLQQKVAAGINRGSGADRIPPREQLEKISTAVRQMTEEHAKCMKKVVLPALEHEGIVIRRRKDLTDSERKYIRDLFRREVYPVLTPLAIDPGHPFPHLYNKTLNLAVLMKRPKHDESLLALVQVPSVLPRFVPLPSDPSKDGQTRYVFVPLETVIRLHLDEVFPGMTLEYDVVFQVTRDSEYEIDDDEVEDLLKTIEEEIRKRRRGNAVRLGIEAGAPPEVEQFIMTALDLEPADVYSEPGLLDATGFFQIYALPGFPHLRDPQFVTQQVPEIAQAANLWAAIRAKDILIHHPYESFSHVVDFIETAATDDRVLAIKQTLYRTSSDSPVVRALQRAADAGKQVTAVIELKARLDEERNIVWSRELEKSGVHVVFGFVGLKTHCKAALVVRREEDGIRRYVHLATGNYNPQTARVYTDLGFFTCDPDFCEDVSMLFNYLTGYGELPQWRKLIVAPSRLQPFMIEKIDQEIKYQENGRGGKIIAKVNGLLEPAIVQALYRASQAGVKVDIICRGICALRPGLAGISDNIRVTSIVDRFLEHSRIFYFGNAGKPEVYIGSADWMDRNLMRRVEVVWPVQQADLKSRIIDEILAISLSDNVKSRELLSDGGYRRVQPADGEPLVRSQERFLQLAAEKTARRLAAADAPRPVETTRPLLRPQRRRRQTG
ncbi:MAG: polyphosphate kinase 1 [Gemmataceae bacterium]